MQQAILLSLFQNTAVVFGAWFLWELLRERLFFKKQWFECLSYGVAYGVIAILSTIKSLEILPGVLIDSKSPILFFGAMAHGPYVAILAGVIAAIFRYEYGGAGATLGAVVCLFSVLLGWLFHAWYKREWEKIGLLYLYVLGIFLTSLSFLFVFLMPLPFALTIFESAFHLALAVNSLTLCFFGLYEQQGRKRKKQTEVIEERENMLFMAQRLGHMAHIRIHCQAKTLYCFDVFCSIFSFPLGTQQIPLDHFLVKLSQESQKLFLESLQAHEPKLMELMAFDAQDKPIYLHWRCQRLLNKKEEIWIDGFLQDITQEKLLQEKVILSARLSSLGEMAAGIAHEIKNHLQIISLCIERLEQMKGNSLPGAYDQQLGRLRKSSRRILKILKNLRSLSRVQNTEKVVFDMHEVILEAVEFAKDLWPEHIQASLCLKAEQNLVEGDPDQFYQVIVNLVNNAQHAVKSKQQGIIEISTRDLEGAVDKVLVSVKDNGCGISPENKNRLFESFFTTKAKEGTGLGLYITSNLVKEMQGQIHVNSVLEEGSEFVLEIKGKKALPFVAEA